MTEFYIKIDEDIEKNFLGQPFCFNTLQRTRLKIAFQMNDQK